MNKTKIPWVKNPDGTQGYTWNPITGCLNGCEYCYARKLANGRLKSRYLANENVPTLKHLIEPAGSFKLSNPFYPRFWEDRLIGIKRDVDYAQSRRWGAKPKSRGVFVCDMSDLFGIGIPEEWTQRVLEVIKDCSNDRFYLLTKQPQNLIKFSPFPEHCYVGVTVTKPEFLLDALDAFDSIQCSVRYLSIEPMLAAFDVPDLSLLLAGSVDWLILGSQTKPYKPPEIEWLEEVVRACDKVGMPVFLKNNLKPCLGGGYIDSTSKHTPIPFDNSLRQEMPTIH